MFDTDFQEDHTSRRARPRLFSLLLILGGILIGVVLVLALQMFVHPAGPTNNNASSASVNAPTVQSGNGGSQSKLPGDGPQSKDNDRPQYFWDILKSQVAQGLHLSVDQVKTKLQSGQHIQDVANAQGISQDQLHSIEINAIQSADDEMVRRGFTTQPNVGYDMQRWTQEEPMQLNGDVGNAFLMH